MPTYKIIYLHTHTHTYIYYFSLIETQILTTPQNTHTHTHTYPHNQVYIVFPYSLSQAYAKKDNYLKCIVKFSTWFGIWRILLFFDTALFSLVLRGKPAEMFLLFNLDVNKQNYLRISF